MKTKLKSNISGATSQVKSIAEAKRQRHRLEVLRRKILMLALCFAVFLASLLLTSCTDGGVGSSNSNYSVFRPHLLFLRNVPKGSDNYSVGWRDGCQAHGSIGGSGLNRLPDPYYNGYKLRDGQYATGFADGQEHCFYYYDWDAL